MSLKPMYKLIDLVSNNFDKIDWECLSANPNAIHLLEKYPNKIGWEYLSRNPNILKLDYEKMKKNCQSLAEELAAYVFNPARLHRFAEKYNLSFEEIMYTY